VLACTKRFHQAIWQGDADLERSKVTYILTGADAAPTVSRAMLIPKGAGWETRFDASGDLKEAVYSFGDGTVTRESLLGLRRGPAENIMRRLPSFYEVFIAGSHMDLPTNPTYMDNVLDMLLD